MDSRKRGTLSTLLLTAFTAAALPSSVAVACAIVSGDGTSVSTAEENVLIVSNPDTGMQHLIRKAAFHSTAKDFGFLVPTPGKPELAEADNAVFDRLSEAIKPKVIHKRKWVFRATLYEFLSEQKGSIFSNVDSSLPTGSAGEEVEVVHQQVVAGYDSTVLKAGDSGKLMKWLDANGYKFKDDLTAWVQLYVDKGWMITAFKFSNSSGSTGGMLSTKAVRMSFSAKEPFFPYREPAGQAPKMGHGRMLKLFVVAPHRVTGSLEDTSFDWHRGATTPYAAQNDDLYAILTGAVPAQAIPRNSWLTVMQDGSWKRNPGGDLLFTTAADQSQIIPPPVIKFLGTYTVPLCADVAVGLYLILRISRTFHKKYATPRSAQPAVT